MAILGLVGAKNGHDARDPTDRRKAAGGAQAAVPTVGRGNPESERSARADAWALRSDSTFCMCPAYSSHKTEYARPAAWV